MKLLAKMMALVATKFINTTDKQGRPYFEHCYFVMQNCRCEDEEELCIALGHDLLEDTDVTLESLYNDFSFKIAAGIKQLTHIPEEESYEDYIRRIGSSQKFLCNIKMADLAHNTHITRLKGISKKDIERIEKYHKAYLYLLKS